MIELRQVIEELQERRQEVEEKAQKNVEGRLQKIDNVLEAMRGYVMLKSKELIADDDVSRMIDEVRKNYLNNK